MAHRKVIIILLLMLLPLCGNAQKTVALTGKVAVMSVDTVEMLPYVNVTILNGADSSYITDAITDNQGIFRIKLKPARKKTFLMRIGYTGMKTYYRQFTDTIKSCDLGTIILESNKTLDEVVVSAPIRIIDIKGDTTIINAEAIKTREGANLEELLRRIPGLLYNKKDNTLMFNGEKLTEIDINGEAFFPGKNEIAMENLPAEIIGKIKIYDKATKEEEFLGIKKTDRKNLVLDIQTKKKFNGTLMTSAEVGAGTYDRKTVSADAMAFKQTGERMIINMRSGNKNNTSIGRHNRNDNVYADVSKKFGKKLQLSGNVHFNGDKTNRASSNYYEQYLISENQFGYSSGNSSSSSKLVNGNVRLNWNPDKKTMINVTAFISNQTAIYHTDNHEITLSDAVELSVKDPFGDYRYETVPDSVKINDMIRKTNSKTNNSSYNVQGTISRRFNKAGTGISLNMNYRNSTSNNNDFSVSSTRYYRLLNYLGNDSVLYRNQYYDRPQSVHSMKVGLTFTHKIGKTYFELSYNLESSRQGDNRNAFDLSPFSDIIGTDQFTTLPDGYLNHYIDSLSNRSVRKTDGHSIELTFGYNTENINANINFKLKPTREYLEQKYGKVQADTLSNRMDINAGGNFGWLIKKKTRIHLHYFGNTHQPQLSQMLTMIDNMDPLNISCGNPDLKPEYFQYMVLNVNNTSLGLNGSISLNTTFNSIIQSVTYDMASGGRKRMPVNINGNWSTEANIGYNKTLKVPFSFQVNGNGSHRQFVNLINEGKKETPDRSVTKSNALGLSLNTSYNPTWGGISLIGRWAFSHDVNSLRETSTYSRDYTVEFNTYFDLPGNIQLRSDLSYFYRNGTGISSAVNSQALWNVAATWKFLKRRQAQISLEWNDILSDRKDFSRNVTSVGLSDRYSPQIGSFVFLSFKYKFNFINSGPERSPGIIGGVM